ncbi:WbqC family protein [Glycomyces sp. NPDC048151]|uniref:WbqC family protein n=1 Tax=Glycomyces sp. NPDC048151 TaxID=3364002 RepID=UPI003716D1F1
MPSTPSSPPDTAPNSSAPDPASRSAVCAIHQPNLLPRMATLAKIAAADTWIVLDTVQAARRDWQHRTRLADLNDPERRQWLSIETRRPAGRATLIRDTAATDPAKAARRLGEMLAAAYRTSPHWATVDQIRRRTLDALTASAALTDIATASTAAMLDAIGWHGTIIRASTLTAGTERTDRLIDLCAAVGARTYLCGTGGLRYVDPDRFAQADIDLVPFPAANADAGPVWRGARQITGLWALAAHGPDTVARALANLATVRGLRPPIAL